MSVSSRVRHMGAGPLIVDRKSNAQVSTFIELSPGKNHFQVEYRDESGRAQKIEMIVDHVREK